MRKGNRIYGIITVLLLSLGACSLIHDDPEELGYREDGSAYAYVSLTIHTGTTGNVTRANPTGGETGDGYEDGQTYENAVSNLTLFFYPAALDDGGVNRNGDIEFTAKVYITNPDQNWDMTDGDQPIDKTFTVGPVKVEGLKTNQQYHVLAVANAEDKTSITSLDALRSATVSTVYTATTSTEGATSYSNFVMASEGDEHPELDISYENSETNPAETTINLERLVARVDYQAIDPKGQPANDGIYEIDNVGTARITGALLVNTLNVGANSYLLKRVTEANAGFNTDVIYLEDETVNNPMDNVATNYVIDPYATSGKQEADFDSNTYFPSIGYENAANWENLFSEGTEVSADGETWRLIGYPKENVNEKGSKRHSTGIIFKANITLTNESLPTTFFEWNGQVCRTAEEAMEKFDSEGWTNAVNGTWEQLDTYGDFRLMMQSMKSGDPTGYKLYLEKALEEKSDDMLLRDDIKALRWAYYMEHECFYKNENGAVQVDIGQISGTTRQILSQYQLHTYKDGVCYYTYWIKHSNDGDEATDLLHGGTGGVMEYAIVRNNIYKLNVTSISTLGDDVPGDRTLEINFSVKNWQVINEDEIPLEPVN